MVNHCQTGDRDQIGTAGEGMPLKRIKRRSWLPDWRIEEVCSWLSDMAAQGWHFEKGSTFVQGEPQQVRYRAEFVEPVGLEAVKGHEVRRELFSEAGWEYVADIVYWEIYRSQNPAALEMHTDPCVQLHSLRPLKFQLLFRQGYWVALVLLVFANSNRIMSLPELIMAVGFVTLVIVDSALAAFHVFRLIQRLKKGIPLNYQVPYKHVVVLSQLTFVLVLLYLAVVLGQLLIDLTV